VKDTAKAANNPTKAMVNPGSRYGFCLNNSMSPKIGTLPAGSARYPLNPAPLITPIEPAMVSHPNADMSVWFNKRREADLGTMTQGW